MDGLKIDESLIPKIVGIVVAIIVVSVVLIPVTGEVTAETATIKNKGAHYSLYEEGETHTITFTADSMITDGVAQPLPDTSVYGAATVAYGNTGIIRYSSAGHLGWYGIVSGSGQSRDLGLATNVTINIAADSIGSTSGASTDRSIGYTIAYANPNGQYALTYTPYVLEDSIIFGAGNTVVGGVNYGIYWTGTVDNITVSSILPPDQEIGDITVNTTNPATNLLKIDSVVIPNITADTDLTYTYFFAPATLVYDNPGYIGDTLAAILSVVPIFVVLAILMGIVGLMYFNRNQQ